MKDKLNNNLLIIVRLLALVGILDAGYLTWTHFQGQAPVCAIAGCEIVLTSSFATIGLIPVALLGLFYYLAVFGLSWWVKKPLGLFLLLVLTSAGLLASFYFVYLQLYVIRAICQYCMLSAFISLLNFLIVFYLFQNRPYQG